jgi:hypothetical protein
MPVVLSLAAAIAAFDWIDYHVKGRSTFLGLNPRCTDQFLGDCYKLDRTNLSWDAQIAVWLDQVLLWGAVGGLAVSALGVIWFFVAYLHDRASQQKD